MPRGTNSDLLNQTHLITPPFLSASEESLIRRCALEIGENVKQLHVDPLGRYGFTGARLFLCYVPGGRAFVIKKHSYTKVSRELKATRSVAPYFESLLSEPRVFRHGSIGALLYKHAGGSLPGAGKARPLNEFVYDFKKYDNKTICRIVESVYDSLSVGKEAIQKGTLRVADAYARYRRLDVNSVDLSKFIIKAALGDARNQSTSRFMGAQVLHPAQFLYRTALKSRLEATLGPIHGDLHPNNIVVDKDGRPFLIDFAWADYPSHRAIDYALLECSLRFLLFPSHINLEDQLRVDEALLSPNGPDVIASLVRKSSLHHYYLRLAMILKIIRRRVMQTLLSQSDGGFSEYLLSQFMILYGLLKYNGYNTPSVVRYLGMIAMRLDRQGI